MTVHDGYGRVTPYETSLPGREFAEEEFRALEEEAEERAVELGDPGAFVLLQAVGATLEKLRIGGEEPELLHQYGALLFQAYHFWKADEALHLLSTPAARYLVEGEPSAEGWEPEAPGPAGYIQLPRHLFWAGPEEEGIAEPVDGFFWTLAPDQGLSLLVVMGMREDRPGLSVAALPPLPFTDATHWLRELVREEGRDFETTLPGGDMEGLYSLVNTGEVLKLAARVFWYLDRFPEALGEEEPPASRGEGPRPSVLPFQRIRLVEEG